MPGHDREVMKERPVDEERLVRYLLDDVTEEERTAIEESFLRDDDGYEELQALEDELRYDYLRGELSPERMSRFEDRFLASAEGRRELDRARAVLEAVDGAAASERARSSPSWWLTAAAAVLVALGGAWAWREVEMARARAEQALSQQQNEEREWARQLADEKARGVGLARDLQAERERRATLEQELRRREEAPPPVRAALVSLALAPGLIRGAEGKSIVLPREAERLRLTLRLPEGQDARSFQASVLDAEGKELWFRGGLERRDSPKGSAVVVDVPARLLAPGDLEVVLLVPAEGGVEEVADYHFGVTRR